MTRWNGPVIATIDMLMALMAVFLVLMSPPVPPKAAASDKPICIMAVDIEWPGDLPTDVDLWVMGPDGRPVGYSAKDGAVFNLVRDDLGTVNDTNLQNRERACARNLPDGEYIVNVHLYHSDAFQSIPVEMIVSLVDPSSAEMREIEKRQVTLEKPGQQITMLRFSIKDGELVTGSENNLPINLREMDKVEMRR